MKKIICFLCLALCVMLTACTATAKVESYKIGTGAHQCCAVIGDSLLTASSESFRVFDAEGTVTADVMQDFKYPAISESADNAIAYDIGGTGVLYFDGSSVKNKNIIISAALNDAGFLSLCTEEAGYKGSVTVYSPEKNEIYKWYSADNWILKAELSPDSTQLAVLCSGESGGSVHLFELDKTEETGLFTADGVVFSDLHWLGDTLCLTSDEGLFFCNSSGKSEGEYSFNGKTLASYAFLDDEAVLELRTHGYGGAGTLIAVNDDAKECGRAAPGAELSQYDYADGRLLILCQGKVICYDKNLKPLGTLSADGCTGAFLRSDDVLLISAGEAKIAELN